MSALSDGKMCFDMKLSCFTCIGLLFQFFCISKTYSQQFTDSVLRLESVHNIRQNYLIGIGDNAEIYHGSEYIRNGIKAVGFPFFETDGMVPASVSYQGNTYFNLNLYYNLVSDEIIISNYAHNALIALPYDKIDSFTIGNHVFISLNTKDFTGLFNDGFYEQLFSGETAIYAKREKKLVIGTGSEENKYIQYDNFFIKLKNVFYKVDGKNSLLELFKDQEPALKKYIRTHKLNFKKKLESSLVLTTIYYSQLTH